MLRLLRDGVLSIVDEDQELAIRNTIREKHKRNLRPHRQVEQAHCGMGLTERSGLFPYYESRRGPL